MLTMCSGHVTVTVIVSFQAMLSGVTQKSVSQVTMITCNCCESEIWDGWMREVNVTFAQTSA